MRRPSLPRLPRLPRLVCSTNRSTVFLTILCLALASLAGCAFGTRGTSSATLTTSPTANTSTPTNSGGSLAIATDHSVYGRADPIHVVISNHTGAPVDLLSNPFRCSLLITERQDSGGAWYWSAPPAPTGHSAGEFPYANTHCTSASADANTTQSLSAWTGTGSPHLRAVAPVTTLPPDIPLTHIALAPGATYGLTLVATRPAQCPPGRYRFVLHYATDPHATPTVYSELDWRGAAVESLPVQIVQ